jgi:SAM-dependent methyltransferase
MNCRFCNTPLRNRFLDLGYAPPSNAYLREADLMKPEKAFPLRLYVCENCLLVQTEDYSQCNELFSSDYAYFSSVSSFFLAHAKSYCEMITSRLGLNKDKFVLEVASNDGYLLKNFIALGIPCLGVEPTTSTAEAAEAIGIPVIREFFGETLALEFIKEHPKADLIIGNNVYAHVPDINDFTAGLKIALKPGGTITLEFQHLLNLVVSNEFDTVYHEHYSYLSLHIVCMIFEKHGLKVFDVEKINTHGGSLRIYGCHSDDPRSTSPDVFEILDEEDYAG